MTLPKVSVVMITYGHATYIKSAIQGVLAQKYEGLIEFIIANDNSPDATDKIITDYLSDIKIPNNFQIKYTKHERNLGAIKNFAWTLAQSTGKYIAFCEGDDYWIDPNKLQMQVDFLEENSEFNSVFARFQSLHEDSQQMSDIINPVEIFPEENSTSIGKELDLDCYYIGWYTHILTGLFRTTTVMSILSKEYSNFIDMQLVFELLHSGKSMCMYKVVAVYRIHDKGMTHSLSTVQHTSMKIKLHEELFINHPEDRRLFDKAVDFIYDHNKVASKANIEDLILTVRTDELKAKIFIALNAKLKFIIWKKLNRTTRKIVAETYKNRFFAKK